MNQYQSLRSQSIASMAGDTQLWNKSIARRIVELLVRFHPSVTEQDREQATPVIITMLAISAGATTGLIALIIFLMN
jgi:hypothetical protein